MSDGITDHAVTTDAGPFAIVPLWVMQRLNEGTSASAGLSVLVALHRWTNTDRYGFPSHASIAKVANISVPTVKRGIKALEDIGALRVVPRWRTTEGEIVYSKIEGADQTSNGYQIRYADPRNDLPLDQIRTHPPGQIRTPPGGQIRSTNQTHCEPDPVEPESTLSGQIVEVVPEWETQFRQFWHMYPRKDSRKNALASFRRMKNHERLEALERLPDHVEMWRREKRERHHIPLPATWLNGERWNDTLTGDYEQPESLVQKAARYALEMDRLEREHENRGSNEGGRDLGRGDDRMERRSDRALCRGTQPAGGFFSLDESLSEDHGVMD